MRTWLCSWLIDCTGRVSPHAAPEIDPANLVGTIAIVVLVTVIWRAK